MPAILDAPPLLCLDVRPLANVQHALSALELARLWGVLSRCKEDVDNGRRLENVAWRLWSRSVSLAHIDDVSASGCSRPALVPAKHAQSMTTAHDSKVSPLCLSKFIQASLASPPPAAPTCLAPFESSDSCAQHAMQQPSLAATQKDANSSVVFFIDSSHSSWDALGHHGGIADNCAVMQQQQLQPSGTDVADRLSQLVPQQVTVRSMSAQPTTVSPPQLPEPQQAEFIECLFSSPSLLSSSTSSDGQQSPLLPQPLLDSRSTTPTASPPTPSQSPYTAALFSKQPVAEPSCRAQVSLLTTLLNPDPTAAAPACEATATRPPPDLTVAVEATDATVRTRRTSSSLDNCVFVLPTVEEEEQEQAVSCPRPAATGHPDLDKFQLRRRGAVLAAEKLHPLNTAAPSSSLPTRASCIPALARPQRRYSLQDVATTAARACTDAHWDLTRPPRNPHPIITPHAYDLTTAQQPIDGCLSLQSANDPAWRMSQSSSSPVIPQLLSRRHSTDLSCSLRKCVDRERVCAYGALNTMATAKFRLAKHTDDGAQ